MSWHQETIISTNNVRAGNNANLVIGKKPLITCRVLQALESYCLLEGYWILITSIHGNWICEILHRIESFSWYLLMTLLLQAKKWVVITSPMLVGWEHLFVKVGAGHWCLTILLHATKLSMCKGYWQDSSQGALIPNGWSGKKDWVPKKLCHTESM